MAIKLQDNFNDNSINTSIWTETDTYSRLTEQNNRLEFASPHTNPSLTLSKVLYMGFIYSSQDSKWEMVALAEEA